VLTHIPLLLGNPSMEPVGNACVLAFFAMSGLVLTRGWDGRFGTFLARRVIRLWPVYAMCMIIGAAILWTVPTPSVFAWYLGYNINTIHDALRPDPPAWSLCIEAWMMPVMPVVAWFGRGSPLRGVLIIPAIAGFAITDWHFSWAGCFMVGAWLSPFSPRVAVLEARLPQWLGKVSYSLYMSHWPTLCGFMALFGPWGLLPGLVAVPCVAWVVWRWVERPSIELSRRVGRQRRDASVPTLAAHLLKASP